MHKRGISLQPEFLIGVLIAVVGFLLLFPFYAKAGERISEKSPEAVCRFSVNARQATALNVEKSIFEQKIKTVPLVCRTQDKTVKGDKDKAAKEIVDLMARCKYQFADGQYTNIFNKDVQGDYCFPCYTLTIEGKDFSGITKEELLEVMNKEKNKKIADMPYGQYLAAFNNAPGRLLVPDKIENKHTYIIYYSDPFEGGRFFFTGSDVATVAAGGFVANKVKLIPIPRLKYAIMGLVTLKVASDVVQRYGLGGTPKFPGVYLFEANEIPKTYRANTFGVLEGDIENCNVVDDFTGR